MVRPWVPAGSAFSGVGSENGFGVMGLRGRGVLVGMKDALEKRGYGG